MNRFGEIYTLTTFGESHGPAIGGVIDGVPAGLGINIQAVQEELDRRRPGQSALTTQRNESDRVKILSGIYEGRTLGSPIGFIIPNNDARSIDYNPMRELYRPNHADFTYDAKYGFRDPRGGGRASARETACRVVAGAIARQFLSSRNIQVHAFLSRIGRVCRNNESEEIAPLLAEVENARTCLDSVGGMITCIVTGMPPGIGEPIYGKLHARLADAMMSIPGAKGFDYGDGMSVACARGSEQLDIFVPTKDGGIATTSNHSGGIQGGISNGMEITMRIALKPTPTLPRALTTVNRNAEAAVIKAHGRHDPCIALRAVPVVEAMTCMVILDAMLAARTSRW